MSGIFNKLKDFVGLNEMSEAEDYDYIEEEDIPKLGEEFSTSVASEESKDKEIKPGSPSYRRLYSENATQGTETVIGSSSRSNVIGMPGLTQSTSEVVVVEPHAFEEMPRVIKILKERRSVVLNLNVMDPEDAQRAVDFVAGGTYAIDGHQERIGESIFLFTPSCVKVSTINGIASEVAQMTESEIPKVAPMKPSSTFESPNMWSNQQIQ